MPGLFGGGGGGGDTGGNGAPVNVPITPIAPPWMKNMRDVTLPAAAPNQDHMLAHNMAAGGFGTPVGNLAWLQSFLKPTPSSVYVPPVAPTGDPRVTRVPPKAPTTPRPKGETGSTGRNLTGRNSR